MIIAIVSGKTIYNNIKYHATIIVNKNSGGVYET